jgi:hypothetical protein
MKIDLGGKLWEAGRREFVGSRQDARSKDLKLKGSKPIKKGSKDLKGAILTRLEVA